MKNSRKSIFGRARVILPRWFKSWHLSPKASDPFVNARIPRFLTGVFSKNRPGPRTAALVSAITLNGCAGIVVEHPVVEVLSADSSHLTAVYGPKLSDPVCRLEGVADDGVMIYECTRKRSEWMFVVVAAGLAIPIPYYRYRHWDSVVVQDGKVVDVKNHAVGATGALCGVVSSNDVPVLGCKYAGKSRVNTWELGE